MRRFNCSAENADYVEVQPSSGDDILVRVNLLDPTDPVVLRRKDVVNLITYLVQVVARDK